MGEYRHCAATEWFYDATAIRYGYTSMDIAPGLWGGFSQYLYLPLDAVLHRVPKGLSRGGGRGRRRRCRTASSGR